MSAVWGVVGAMPSVSLSLPGRAVLHARPTCHRPPRKQVDQAR